MLADPNKEIRSQTFSVLQEFLREVRDADTICVVTRGKIAERGTHDELIGNPEGVYTKLVARQMKAGGANSGSQEGSQEGSLHAGQM